MKAWYGNAVHSFKFQETAYHSRTIKISMKYDAVMHRQKSWEWITTEGGMKYKSTFPPKNYLHNTFVTALNKK